MTNKDADNGCWLSAVREEKYSSFELREHGDKHFDELG